MTDRATTLRTALSLLAALALRVPAFAADDGAALAERAGGLYQAKDYAACATAFESAFALGFRTSTTAYNAACCHALAGQVDAAIEWLEKAQAEGDNGTLLLHDRDLDSLRADPRFEKLAAAARSAVAVVVKRPPAASSPRGDAVPAAERWPSFRGVRASGVATGPAPPTVWNVDGGENVLWQTALPGLGHSSPIVWGDRIFVTTAVSGEDAALRVGLYGDIESVPDANVYRWQVLALDRHDGSLVWLRTAHRAVPTISRHPKATHANSTPATDGRHVVALFGSEGLYCYDIDGDLLWHKDLGVLDSGYFAVPQAQWGFGSSPVIHDGKVIVQADVQTGSFLAAFALADGKELWRAARDEVPTWSSPTVITEGGRTQVVVNGYKHAGGYDLADGAELWRMRGRGDIPVPTPVVGHGLVFLTSAHGGPASIFAIRLGAEGDVTLGDGDSQSDAVAWSVGRGGAYMQTPLVAGDYLYVCRDNGALYAYEAATGKQLYEQRVASGGGFTASMVAAGDHIYVTSETGDVFVVKAGPEYELVGTNELGEVCLATPAIAGGALYFRTRSSLIAIGSDGGS